MDELGILLKKDLVHILSNHDEYVVSSPNQMQTMTTRNFARLSPRACH